MPLPKFDMHKQTKILMEARKDFERPQTPSAPHTPRKGNQVKEFFQYCLDILEDPLVTQKLLKALRNCMEVQDELISAPFPKRGVRQVKKKKRTRKEFKFFKDIGGYEMNQVILDLGSDVNILPKNSWEQMGKPKLVWSPI